MQVHRCQIVGTVAGAVVKKKGRVETVTEVGRNGRIKGTGRIQLRVVDVGWIQIHDCGLDGACAEGREVAIGVRSGEREDFRRGTRRKRIRN